MANETQDGFSKAFSALWGTAQSVGIDLLKQEGAARVAERETKNLIQQQSLYTQLAQQTPNLGPNEVPEANKAAVTQTKFLTGNRAVQQAFEQPIFMWFSLVVILGILVYLIGKKK